MNKKDKIVKNCQFCKKQFQVLPHRTKKKFCSNDCRKNFVQSLVNYSKCFICNAEFKITDSELKKGKKYCSNQCYYKSRIGSGNPRYQPNEGWLNCKNCQKQFRVHPYQLKAKKGKVYCSKECKEKVFYKLNVNCIECKLQFSVIPSRFNRKDAKTLFCSKTCRARFQSHNPESSNGICRNSTRGGKREDLNKYFRSSWEANYARYLNYLIETKVISHWEYESDTFDFSKDVIGVQFYTPDFKVFDKSGNYEYHEVKGWMDKKSEDRLLNMKTFYKSETVVLIDRPVYSELSKKYKNIIPNWEKDN